MGEVLMAVFELTNIILHLAIRFLLIVAGVVLGAGSSLMLIGRRSTW